MAQTAGATHEETRALRSPEEIDAAKRAIRQRDLELSIQSLPPGYIEGFKMTLEDNGRLKISAGVLNLKGQQITVPQEVYVTEENWLVDKLASTEYYIYVSTSGKYVIDRFKPEYHDADIAWYHPILGHRSIGRLYVDTNGNDIIFAQRKTEDEGAMVVVAPSTYTGDGAHYYCDGSEDEITIQKAIKYGSGKYGGAVIHLMIGTYKIETSAIDQGYDDIVVEGEGFGTIIEKNGNFHAIEATGGSGSEVNRIQLKNLQVTRNSADTNSEYLVHFEYSDDVTIENVLFYDANAGGVDFEYCERLHIMGCFIRKFSVRAIIIQNSEAIIDSCTIDGESISVSDVTYAISLTTSPASIVANCRIINMESSDHIVGIYFAGGGIKIVDCYVKNITTTGAAKAAYGIYVNNDDNQILNNYIDDMDADTIANGVGIYIVDDDNQVIGNYSINNSGKGIRIVGAGSARTLLTNNFCQVNGSDTGIANENEHNFDDTGTDTQIHSNSWQQPVSGQSAIGELKLIPEADRSTSLSDASISDSWEECDLSGSVPNGTNAILFWLEVIGVAATDRSILCVRDGAGSEADVAKTRMMDIRAQIGAGGDQGVACPVIIKAENGIFDYRRYSASYPIDSVTGILMGYFV